MRADKPVGSYLLLWPTLWALMIAAQGLPPWWITAIFVAGVFVMRSAGCVINDYADRKVDGKVARTNARPLVSGVVTDKQALGLFATLVGVAFLLVLALNWQTIVLSIGALGLAAVYPFMKRYTHLPQVVLGAAFAWAIPMAFMAVNEAVPGIAWWLFSINVLWTVAYDTEYAMVDRNDDLQIGVKSTAILFGQYDRLIIGLLQLSVVLMLLALGQYLHFTLPFYLGVLVVVVLFVYQQRLIYGRDRQACFTAFLNNNYVGMAIAIGIAGHYFI
ncbi:4-hydroxybenzoate octaprenyltransferase [Paraglaciecola chathamensis]|uniref:4-hydroxybenzoate octaprenyltransferase n=1 Tax=Paraglaciecola chathamensis TaxID=368405 RepID=UPI0026FE364A|nr:4-hydroxybenzoate octaprenyltransferase [Paraglaciecola chathamensis]MDO6559388.1 4-hydroxybenzoate octaprenyltransferase [Paraglaciecola chathamensis]